MAKGTLIIVSRREAADVRHLWLRRGEHETSDLLGLDSKTLGKVAARLPISHYSARRLRAAFSRVTPADEI
jgi:muconolactone delta-isomerase